MAQVVVKLLNDIARCQDTECPDRVICARWMQRSTGRVHVATMRKGAEHCPGLILDEEVRA